jgi:polysaccharide transporter, PST family
VQDPRPSPKLLTFLPASIRARILHRPRLLEILTNSGWLFGDKILRMGVGLLVGVWIARYLGPRQFGLWNYALAFAALFSAFSTLGLDSVLMRELVRHPDRTSALLGSALALKLVGGVLALLISIAAIAMLPNSDFQTVLLVAISAAVFVFQSANVIEIYFQAKVQSRSAVIAGNASFLLITVVKVWLIASSASLISFALASLGEAMLTALFLLLAYNQRKLNQGNWSVDRELVVQLLRSSWPLLLASLAVMLYMRIDIVMLQNMAGDREAGIYAAATRISETWYFLPGIIVASVSPSLIRCRENDIVLYAKRLRKLYFLMAWFAIAVSLPLSLLSGRIVELLYGREFANAGPVLAIHLWACFAVFLGVASSQYLLIEQLQRISFYRTLIGLSCNVALNLVLIPRAGAKGAAIATVISYFVATYALVLFKATRSHAAYLLLAPFARS